MLYLRQELMYSIRILKYGLNKVLGSHVASMELTSVNLPKRTFFIYNISPKNLLCSLFYKLIGYDLYYHLHDPIPHHGWKRWFVFVFQFIQVIIVDKLIVFSPTLLDLVHRYYLFNGKIIIASHGYSSSLNTKESIGKSFDYGWFGTYASYKYELNIKKCINILGDKSMIFVGQGYPDISIGEVYSKYLGDSDYYKLMNAVTSLVVVYKDVSFSGVIHDGVGLGKSFVANEICKQYILQNYSHYYVESSKNGLYFLSCGKPVIDVELGWSPYVKKVFYE